MPEDNDANKTGNEQNDSTPKDSKNDGKGSEKGSEKTPVVTYEDDGRVMVVDGKRFVIQDHVNELVGSARTEGRNAGKTEAEKAAERAAEAAKNETLKEQGQFKDLYEAEQNKVRDLQTELETANATIRTMQTDGIRAKVAAKYKIPAELANRIIGDDEAAMDADAKLLAEKMGVVPAVDTQTGKGTKGPGGVSEDSDDDSDGADNTPKHGDKKNETRFQFQTPGEVRW